MPTDREAGAKAETIATPYCPRCKSVIGCGVPDDCILLPEATLGMTRAERAERAAFIAAIQGDDHG